MQKNNMRTNSDERLARQSGANSQRRRPHKFSDAFVSLNRRLTEQLDDERSSTEAMPQRSYSVAAPLHMAPVAVS